MFLGVVSNGLAAREILTEQPVGVFVAAPLPRFGWVTKVDLEAGINGETNMVCHLAALVPSQRAAQVLGQGEDLLAQANAGALSVDARRELEEHHEASAPLHQGADGIGPSAE